MDLADLIGGSFYIYPGGTIEIAGTAVFPAEAK
jgi:hypothetical protein